MIPVEEALARLLGPLTPLGAETVALFDALGRVLAEDVVARRTQPPFAASAMDGYAVRAVDVATVPARLRVVGTIAAGAVPRRGIGPGEAMRIFTGAPLPEGADAIVIQEDADAEGDTVCVREGAAPGRYVREAGLDFREGALGLKAGRRLTARDIGLAAAMNRPWLLVRRRPVVAILPTGDEIVLPGEPVGPGQIVSANGFALAAAVSAFGGAPRLLPIAPDDVEALTRALDGADGADLVVTSGGASVGEHDLVHEALAARGFSLDFWRIAMRPGKPLMVGRLGDATVIGLPGNPVSAMVCALLFVKPAIRRLLGEAPEEAAVHARLTSALPANDRRQDYLRARLARGADGTLDVAPFPRQDSSMLSVLSAADALVIRPPLAPPAAVGDRVPVIAFGELA